MFEGPKWPLTCLHVGNKGRQKALNQCGQDQDASSMKNSARRHQREQQTRGRDWHLCFDWIHVTKTGSFKRSRMPAKRRGRTKKIYECEETNSVSFSLRGVFLEESRRWQGCDRGSTRRSKGIRAECVSFFSFKKKTRRTMYENKAVRGHG